MTESEQTLDSKVRKGLTGAGEGKDVPVAASVGKVQEILGGIASKHSRWA